MVNKNFKRSERFYHGNLRGHFDEQGFSTDPIERAGQISQIQRAAKSGNEHAKQWIDKFFKTNYPPSSFESVQDRIIAQDNHNIAEPYILPPEYQGLIRSENPKEDFAQYDFFMDTLISKANKGDVDSLEILQEQNFTFAPTIDQPFNPKIFESYQDHNKFILDIERKCNPRTAHFTSSFSQDEPEFYYLREKFEKMRIDIIHATGQNTLDKKEIKELKAGITGLTQTKKILEKKIERLEKIIESDSGERRLPSWEDGFGKIPPQAIDLEEIILGSALKNGNLIEDVSQPYLSLMFYREAHQKIHKTMMDIKGKVTLPKVLNRLRDKGDLDSVGGIVYLESLLNKAIDDTKVLKSYFEILEYKYLRREVIKIATDVQNEAFKDDIVDSVPEWVRGIALKFLDVMPYRFKIYYDLKSIVGQTIGNFRKLIQRNGRPEVSTGYQNVDRFTHGIVPGSLIFTGMRGKNGKTTYTTNIADNVAKQNRHVLIFTYESTREEIIQKLIAKRARVDLEKMVYYDDDDTLTAAEKRKIYQASLEVRKLPIIIEGRPAEPEYITRMVAFYKGMYPDLSLVVIDGLQAFTKKEMPKGKNKSDYLYDTLTGFKNEIAIDLNVAVWVNGQLKQDVEMRKSKRPMGSGDYSDCKAITEVADVAMLGYRPGKYFENEVFQGWIALWPTDARSGAERGRACRLGFEGKYANVYELPKEQRKYDYAKYDAMNPKKKIAKKDAE